MRWASRQLWQYWQVFLPYNLLRIIFKRYTKSLYISQLFFWNYSLYFWEIQNTAQTFLNGITHEANKVWEIKTYLLIYPKAIITSIDTIDKYHQATGMRV